MATITLRKSKFDNIKNVLDKLGANFNNYQSCLNELKHTAEGVDSSTCNLEDTINDIADSSESQKDKVEKIKQLNRKIENFVNTAVQKEKSARNEIVRKKNDFYKKYKNLKPDCEKSYLQRACEKGIEITRAINNWIEEHLDIIITALIVLAAVVICIFCPAAVIAIIGIIAGALSAVMGIADMVCMGVNNGKGIAETLADNGHGTLAKIWSGTSDGLDIASLILPAGAGIKLFKSTAKTTLKSSLKNFAKHPFKTIGNGAKNKLKSIGTSIKKWGSEFADSPMKKLKSSFVKQLKSVSGYDDIADLSKIGELKKFVPKEKLIGNTLDSLRNENFDSISKLDFKYTDDDFEKNVQSKIKKFNSKGEMKDNKSINASTRYYLQKQILDQINTDDNFRERIMKQTGINTELHGKRNSDMTVKQFYSELSRNGLTLHEDFNRNIIQIVPTEYHELISHNGGTAKHMHNMLDDGKIFSNGADFKLKEEAQNLVSEYKKTVKDESMINKIIKFNMQNEFKDTVGKVGEGIHSLVFGQ